MAREVAALFVQTGGVYFGLDLVHAWDKPRDARRYVGPHPVVAHPPCERWGRYWYGGPMCDARGDRKVKGDDEGCFAAALAAVRTWGGVLEHPEASAAWRQFGLISPPRDGGWIAAGDWCGWTCCVEQGHYGHRARKATWLYAAGMTVLPSLHWGKSSATARLDLGAHSTQERRQLIARMRETGQRLEQLSARERAATPAEFRDILLALARSAQPPRVTDLCVNPSVVSNHRPEVPHAH